MKNVLIILFFLNLLCFKGICQSGKLELPPIQKLVYKQLHISTNFNKTYEIKFDIYITVKLVCFAGGIPINKIEENWKRTKVDRIEDILRYY